MRQRQTAELKILSGNLYKYSSLPDSKCGFSNCYGNKHDTGRNRP